MLHERFRHTGVLYASGAAFASAAADFLGAGLAAGDDAVMVLAEADAAAVTARLGGAASAGVTVIDPNASPARLMAHIVGLARSAQSAPAGDRSVRVVGDVGRLGGSASAQAEAILSDALLDQAGGAFGLDLLCGFPDGSYLGGADTAAGRERFLACHRHLLGESGQQANADHNPDLAQLLFAEPLPEPGVPVSVYCSNGRPLSALREFVAEHAQAAQLPQARRDDLVLAAHEVATNSLRHAGTEPIVRMWREAGGQPASVVCEIRDRGVIADPMAGRLLPDTDREDGRGLWLANQLCTLAQVRSSPEAGTTVRLHMWA